MQVVRDKITVAELQKMSEKMFGNLVKAVVDIEQKIMIIDGQMHEDQEMYFLEKLESKQENLWGINLHPQEIGTDDWIEFDSMINVRPWQGNRSRSVQDSKIQKIIIELVNRLVVV